MEDQTLPLELTFVSVEDEQLASSRKQERAAFQQFLSQWSLEDIPACNVGMLHLMRFAQAHPAMFELAQKRNLIDPPQPFVQSNQLWRAFVAHCTECHDCKEDGATPRLYEGRQPTVTDRA